MTVVDNVESPPAKVPVWQTTAAGYRDTLNNWRAFVTAAALPCLFVIALEYFLPEASEVPGAGFLRFLLETFIAALFELAWFRFLLLHGDDARPGLLPRPGRRLATYFGYSLLLMLLHLPYMLFIYDPERLNDAPWMTYALIVVLYLTAVYFNLRFTFTFIWIAIDEAGRLGASWRATRKNGLRLMIIVLATGLPFLIALAAFGFFGAVLFPDYMSEVASSADSGWVHWFDIILSQLLLFTFYGVSSAAMARAFCHLTGWMSDRGELLRRFE